MPSGASPRSTSSSAARTLSARASRGDERLPLPHPLQRRLRVAPDRHVRRIAGGEPPVRAEQRREVRAPAEREGPGARCPPAPPAPARWRAGSRAFPARSGSAAGGSPSRARRPRRRGPPARPARSGGPARRTRRRRSAAADCPAQQRATRAPIARNASCSDAAANTVSGAAASCARGDAAGDASSAAKNAEARSSEGRRRMGMSCEVRAGSEPATHRRPPGSTTTVIAQH